MQPFNHLRGEVIAANVLERAFLLSCSLPMGSERRRTMIAIGVSGHEQNCNTVSRLTLAGRQARIEPAAQRTEGRAIKRVPLFSLLLKRSSRGRRDRGRIEIRGDTPEPRGRGGPMSSSCSADAFRGGQEAKGKIVKRSASGDFLGGSP